MKKKNEVKKEKHEKKINPTEVIKRGNDIYIIDKVDDESREVYLNRTNYIINEINNNHINFDVATKRSYIWRNIKFKGMSYPSYIKKNINL